MKKSIFIIVLLVIVFFTGCQEEEYIKDGIRYKSKALYDSIIMNIDTGNFNEIRRKICESPHSIIPLQDWQLREINLLTTEMHIKIHQADPSFESNYLDKNYDAGANQGMMDAWASGASLKASSIFTLAIVAVNMQKNNEILNRPEIKKIILPYEKKMNELIEYFKKTNIGKCDFMVNEFKLGNWDEAWSISKSFGAYPGKYRTSKFKVLINNVYKLDLTYTDYDNKTFDFKMDLQD